MSEQRTAIQLISTGGIYGAERALLELAGYLREQNWNSHVVALEGRGAGDLVRLAAEQGLHAEAFVPDGRMAFRPMMRRLRALLAEHPRAILHSHGYKPDLLLGILGARSRLACVSTCHSWYSDTIKLKALEIADKLVLRSFDHVVAVSDEIRSEVLRTVPEPRVTLINNGISTPPADPRARRQVRAEFNLPENCQVIVQVGRLAGSKRNDLLIAALPRLQRSTDTYVLLVGDGELRGVLAQDVAARGLEARVIFCGYRPDSLRFLAAADALVLSSDKEGLPITILEAMASRCPIVATRVGAIGETLRDGVDGWLVPPGDAAALTCALNEVLAGPAQARLRAESAYHRFETQYSRAVMGRRYLQIYDAVWRARGWIR
jgi:glycosyltransferase involved in cell wall biosynthesis